MQTTPDGADMDIKVDLKEKSYIVTMERGALKNAGEIFDLNRKVLVVSDDGVPSEYAYEICSQSKNARRCGFAARREKQEYRKFSKTVVAYA